MKKKGVIEMLARLRKVHFHMAVTMTAVFIAFVTAGIAARAMAGSATVVTMTDTPAAFIPAKVTLKVGQTIEWKNTGQSVHGVTSMAVPAGAQDFDSDLMMPGATFSYTFAVPGTYKYVCTPHSTSGMAGEVTVTK